MKKYLLASAALAVLALPVAASAEPAMAEKGKDVKMVLLPKFLGIAVFDQAHTGAVEAQKELGDPSEVQFLGPTPENSVAGQIEIVTNATTQGVNAILISNNSGDQIAPAAKAAKEKGIKVVTWDSPIPSAEGEDVFVAQVDFAETGTVMADMALSILGENGGEFAILSASPDAANQNSWIQAMENALKDPKYAKLKQVDLVYGNDQSEESYNQALALVDKHPDLGLIMAPTTVGIAAAAKAMQDEGLCDKVKVSGLGLPAEMVSYTMNGCAPEFALWSFIDLGYLTYYTAYLLATDAITAEEGQEFAAGRMGNYTITKDPTRDAGLRVLMGPFSVYNKDNVEAAAEVALRPDAGARGIAPRSLAIVHPSRVPDNHVLAATGTAAPCAIALTSSGFASVAAPTGSLRSPRPSAYPGRWMASAWPPIELVGGVAVAPTHASSSRFVMLLPEGVAIDGTTGAVSPSTGRYEKRLSDLRGFFHDDAALRPGHRRGRRSRRLRGRSTIARRTATSPSARRS